MAPEDTTMEEGDDGGAVTHCGATRAPARKHGIIKDAAPARLVLRTSGTAATWINLEYIHITDRIFKPRKWN